MHAYIQTSGESLSALLLRNGLAKLERRKQDVSVCLCMFFFVRDVLGYTYVSDVYVCILCVDVHVMYMYVCLYVIY
jgi:hypothetical protein